MSDTTPNQSSPDTTPVTSGATGTPEATTVTSSTDTTPVTDLTAETIVEPRTSADVSADAVVAEAVVPVAVSAVLPWYRRPVVVQYAIAFLIVALMGAGLVYLLEKQGRMNTQVFSTLSALLLPEPAVATVNGVSIGLSKFEKSRDQLQAQAAGQGADPTEATIQAQIETEALDILINTELLRQAAEAGGVLITDEQVTARYDEIVASQGGEEQLAARMTELGITKESLDADIRGELLIQTHLASALDASSIVVSDADIEAFYKSVASSAGPTDEIPPLVEVRDQIVQQLRLTQEQELVTKYLDSLKAEAEIERLR